MVPSRAVLDQMMNLFATYVAAQIVAPHWVLKKILNPFTPGPNLVAADVTVDPNWALNTTNLVAFAWVGKNPYTQNGVFTCVGNGQADQSSSAGIRTIYGVIIQEQSGNTPVASLLFANPVVINSVNDVLFNPPLSFELPVNAVR